MPWEVSGKLGAGTPEAPAWVLRLWMAQNAPHFGPSFSFCSVPWGWMVEAQSSEATGSIFYPVFSNPVLFKALEGITVARKIVLHKVILGRNTEKVI